METQINRAEAIEAAEALATRLAPEIVAEPLAPALSAFMLIPCAFSLIDAAIGELYWLLQPGFWIANVLICAGIFVPLEIRRRRHLRLREKELKRLLGR